MSGPRHEISKAENMKSYRPAAIGDWLRAPIVHDAL